MILTIISFIVMLSIIVIVHELGHLLTAKKFGVYCSEFSIGMGPVLYQRKGKRETKFSIRAIPVGGFVSMAGESEDGDKQNLEMMNVPYERTIQGIKAWKQIVVMLAGIVMNILLAWVIMVGITMYQGKVIVPSEPIVASVVKDSPAQKAGLKEGDKLIEISNEDEKEAIDSYQTLIMYLQTNTGKSTLTLERDGKKMNVLITPIYNKESNSYMIGTSWQLETKDITPLEAIPYGTKSLINGSGDIFKSLGNIMRGKGLESLSGPVGIFKVTANSTKGGVLSLLSLTSLLSLNIAIFNLLPLPILDGGRVLIVAIERLWKRKISNMTQNIIMIASIAVIALIFVFSTYNDILRLF